jgi:hypothetical protein
MREFDAFGDGLRQEQKAQPRGKGQSVGQGKQLIGAHGGLRSFKAWGGPHHAPPAMILPRNCLSPAPAEPATATGQ